MDNEKTEDNRVIPPTAGALLISKDGMSLVPPNAQSFFVDDPDLAQWVEDEMLKTDVIHFGSELGFEGIINILSFLMYAMEKDEWKNEFIDELEETYAKEDKKTPPEKKIPPYLRVVK